MNARASGDPGVNACACPLAGLQKRKYGGLSFLLPQHVGRVSCRMEGDTTSTTIFGNRLKYDDQKAVDNILETHGYRVRQDGSNQIILDDHKAILFEKYLAEELKI